MGRQETGDTMILKSSSSAWSHVGIYKDVSI